MDGPVLRRQPFPDGTSVSYDIGGVTGDSRLLKVNNRGTCQLCHDPTDTVRRAPIPDLFRTRRPLIPVTRSGRD